MREMADNDLLIDERYREDIKKYMLNRGYSIHFAGVTNHDEYTKPPVYNFEFHTRLSSTHSARNLRNITTM